MRSQDYPFVFYLNDIQFINDEYIVLDVMHQGGKFAGDTFRNEVHIKSKGFSKTCIAVFERLKAEGDLMSIEQESEDFISVSQGELMDSCEEMRLSVYSYEERNIKL